MKTKQPLPPLDGVLYKMQKGRCALCKKPGDQNKMWVYWIPPGLIPDSLMHPECYELVESLYGVDGDLARTAIAYLAVLPRDTRFP